jgi:hypothetical protein
VREEGHTPQLVGLTKRCDVQQLGNEWLWDACIRGRETGENNGRFDIWVLACGCMVAIPLGLIARLVYLLSEARSSN